MDINKLFKAAERKCGRVLKMLPRDEIGSPRQYLMDILKNETLPTLDIVYPRLFSTTFSLTKLIPLGTNGDVPDDVQDIDSRYSAYRIPLELTEGCEIMFIKSCVPASQWSCTGVVNNLVAQSNQPMSIGYMGAVGPNRWGRYSSANMYEVMASSMLSYADKMVLGNMQQPFRFKFEPPNIIRITRSWAQSGDLLTATFGLKNDPNLISIPDSAFDGIKKLFILDVKAAIYAEYGIYQDIDTPYGTISLNISDWSTAESDRNELEQQYRSTAHFRNTSMRSG